ncbi:unnamed protein product [Didymodactylos carnosus]|nr:unnamed protein product [Didymodactylos carnosus]CAF3527212.1 unnamed protein product [Didymodactylos carnosus]
MTISDYIRQFDLNNAKEKKLYEEINTWEQETIADVRRTAENIRSTLRSFISSFHANFNDDTKILIEKYKLEQQQNAEVQDVQSNLDKITNRLEKLQIEYEHYIADIKLIKRDHKRLLEIEAKYYTNHNLTIPIYQSSQECEEYVPITTFGKRISTQPKIELNIGRFWAMGGSNEYVILQEYENNLLTIFDRFANKQTITWHYDVVIRDIQWYDNLKNFFILIDKTLILFDPYTKQYDEVSQVQPYQNGIFRRCTCWNDRLFLSYFEQESCIEYWEISTWQMKQRWFTPITCKSNEIIACLRLNYENHLGLSIQDETIPRNRRFRFEIRDITMNNILHTLQLNVDYGIFSRMIPLHDNNWVVLNIDETCVFIIDDKCELKDRIDYQGGTLVNVALISSNTAVIRTTEKLYFYDI